MRPKLTLAQQRLLNDFLAETSSRTGKDIVETLARKHHIPGTNTRASYEDLVGDGYLALCEAIVSWNPARGPFKPYAMTRIKWAFQQSDHAHSYPIHITYSAHRTIQAIRRAINQGHDTVDKVAQATGLKPSKVAELWQYRVQGGAVLDDSLQIADSSDSPEDVVEKSMERDLVREAVEALSEPAQSIIRARFGFTTGEPMTSDEICQFLGVDIDTVRQAESEAMAVLEKAIKTSSDVPKD